MAPQAGGGGGGGGVGGGGGRIPAGCHPSSAASRHLPPARGEKDLPRYNPPRMSVSSIARFTVFDDIDRIHDGQQRRRDAVGATSASERIAKIKRLHDALLARRDEIRRALWDDYRKPAAEVDLSEIYPVLGEARHARRHLREWMEPQYVPAPAEIGRAHV